MFRRYAQAIAVIVLLFTSSSAYAENWVCAQDVNGDGTVDAQGETASCDLQKDGGMLCPINASACTQTQPTCIKNKVYWHGTTINEFNSLKIECSYDTKTRIYRWKIRVDAGWENGTCNDYYLTINQQQLALGQINQTTRVELLRDGASYKGTCNFKIIHYLNTGLQGCDEYGNCQFNIRFEDTRWGNVWNKTFTFSEPLAAIEWTCPLGNNACYGTDTAKGCSISACTDLDATTRIIEDPLETPMLQDDGTRNPDGSCAQQVYIFTGRPMECHPEGVDTAFQDCCDHDGAIAKDSVGNSSQLGSTSQVIQHTYGAVSSAYAAYTTEIAAGGTSTTAIAAGEVAASKYLLTLLNPTTIAIAVVTYLIVDYLTQACDQTDMETAMLKESKYCHFIGKKCVNEWIIGGCIQQAKVYCCFNSELARIIHEQGRSLLETFSGWGTIRTPECRGFSPEEFQALDFSRIDLSSYYDILQTEAQSVIEQNLNDGIQNYYNNIN